MLAIIVLFPLYITVVNSLLRPVDITRPAAEVLPDRPAVGAATSDAWNAGHMGTYLKNSFIVTFIITVGQVAHRDPRRLRVRVPASSRSSASLFVVFLATLMVPFEVTIVTNVTTISNLGCTTPTPGSRCPFLATGFGAFLMRQTFLTLPGELRDAAALDGYGHWRFLWRVAVPLARPAVAALTVFAFLAAWNQYLWPLLVTKDDKLRTVQIGLKQLQQPSIDQINVDVRGGDHRGDPAGDPAPCASRSSSCAGSPPARSRARAPNGRGQRDEP